MTGQDSVPIHQRSRSIQRMLLRHSGRRGRKHTLRISSRSSLKPSAIDAIQNLRNFSLRACSLSGVFGGMNGGISTAGCGEGESRCKGGSARPDLDDGRGKPTPSTPRSESSCDSSDEDDTSSPLSSVSVPPGAAGFSSCLTVTGLFGVDASDVDDEEESSSEDDESDTILLFRFLFLFLAGFSSAGPIC